jgi:hypothetical protein
MQKPRIKSNSLLLRKGQSVLEYLVLFVILAGLSFVMIPKVQTIFTNYVTAAKGAMQ